MCFVLPLPSLDTLFSYTCISYPKTYAHNCRRKTFTLCLIGTLRSYGDLNKLHIWCFSSSEPRRDHIYSIQSIVLSCRQGCTSYIHRGCDPKLASFQLTDLPTLHYLSQLLVTLFAHLFLLMTVKKGFQSLFLCKYLHFGSPVFLLPSLFSQSLLLPYRSQGQQLHTVFVSTWFYFLEH